MSNYTTEAAIESRVNWQRLEEFARMEVQKFIQRILEEEVAEHPGRGRSRRKSTIDCGEGYRNGYGKPRQLSMTSGTITVRRPRLVAGDGRLGIWGALANVFPDAREQRRWNHRIVNVMDKLPKKKQQAEARPLLTSIPYAETREEAEDGKAIFRRWCDKNGCAAAGELLEKDWERMVTFYGFPKEHWRHLRTTNIIESPFATVRLRTTASKRYKKVENATAVIWKTLMTAQKSFRKLNAHELMADVADGATYINGVMTKKVEMEIAA